MKNHIAFQQDHIEQQEMVIADEHSLPMSQYSEPYISSHLTIVLNHTGYSNSLFDMQHVEFQQHNIAVILPEHVISNGYSSEDYWITLIIISKSFYDELIHRESFTGYLKYQKQT